MQFFQARALSRLAASAAALTCFFVSAPAIPQETKPKPQTLFINCNIFDGVNETLEENGRVLVEGSLVKSIGGTDIKSGEDATVIDCKGGTLMPGLIDAHWHTTYAYTPQSTVISGDISEIAIRGAFGAKKTLMRGFTTVRDTGGNPFAIKKLTDAGLIVGPRILPSGPPITQTGGHLDYRPYQAVPMNKADSQWYWYANALMLQADGVPEVILRAREVMRMGASQIKIAAGGGVSSLYDPIDVRQYTKAELEAFVEIADTYNTYVTAHIFTDDAAQVAIRAGVKSLEHGMLFSRETLQLMKDNDVWLSIQPILNDENALKFDDPVSTAKFEMVTAGTARVYQMAKEIGVKIAFGTDMLFDPVTAEAQTKFLTKLKPWFTPYEILKMATSNNAELLELAGPRHPYQAGPLGKIVEGAYADMIVVNGNPLKDLELLADPHKNFALIMKDGKVYKNTIE